MTLSSGASALSPWTLDGYLPQTTAFDGAVATGGDLFVFGGNPDGTVLLDTSYLYHPGGTSTSTPSLPQGRENSGYVTHAGRVYAVGGYGSGGAASNLWSIDPGSDTSWTTHTALPTARYKVAAVSLGDYIYSVGGHTESPSANLTVNQRIDPNGAATWETMAAMSTPRSGAGAVGYDGKMYVFGGQNSTIFHSSMEVYDPVADSWSNGPSMITPRQNFGTVLVGDRVYVLGGETTGQVPTATVEYFDFGLGQWFSDTPLPVALAGVRAVLVGDDIYALGGQPAGGPATIVDTVYVSHAVPLPATGWLGITLLGGLALLRTLRRPHVI